MAETQGESDFVTLTIDVTPEQAAPLQTAAEACGLTLEEFVVAAACDAAIRTLAA